MTIEDGCQWAAIDGEVVVDGTVRHIYTFRDGKISRMEVATGTGPA
jgi:hypothetical protein